MVTELLDGVTRWLMALVFAVLLVLVGWGGYRVGAANGERLAATERERVQKVEQAATDVALQHLQAAQARGDTLTRQLAAATRAASKLRKERDDALARVTTGRVCLDESALRVLNGAPGLRIDLPDTAGGTVGADAGRVATDTDLGGWALDAGRQYDECRQRLDALIDWHGDTTQ